MKTLNGLLCADVPLRNCPLTHVNIAVIIDKDHLHER